MSAEEDRISIYELEHPPGEQDPRVDRTEEQINRVQERFEESGWLSPIIYTTDDLTIVDGNTRVRALKAMDNGVEDLRILGEYQGYGFALPDADLAIDPEEASAELNIFRENLSEPDRAKFLDYLVQSRIIDDEGLRVAGDATDEISTSSLLLNLENDRRDDREYEWEHGEKTKERLKEFLAALDFNSPERARNILTTYQDAPEHVRNLWIYGELYSGHVTELTRIREQLDEGAELADSFTAGRGHTFDDLVEFSRREYEDDDEYYRRADLRDIHDELESRPRQSEREPEQEKQSTKSDKEKLDESEPIETPESREEFLESLDEEHTEMIEEMTIDGDHPFIEFVDHDNMLDFLYDNATRGHESIQRNPEQLIEDLKEEFDKMAKRGVQLDDFPFEATPFDGKFEGSNPHLAPPLLLDEQGNPIEVEDDIQRGDDYTFGIFFHDNRLMDMEVPDDHLHLLFFSPPYFDQAGEVQIKQWLPEEIRLDDVEGLIENRSLLDEVYEKFLEELLESLRIFTRKLRDGRYMVINLSDIMPTHHIVADSLRVHYDIPADVSSMIRRKIPDLHYLEKIRWVKTETSQKRGGQYWDREGSTAGYPLEYYPKKRVEELLVFRKNELDHTQVRKEFQERFNIEFESNAEFKGYVGHEDPSGPLKDLIAEEGKFDDKQSNVWKIEQVSGSSSNHPSAFPVDLARAVVEMYSIPGDRVADPYAGACNTLEGVRRANEQAPQLPNRIGYAWENTAAERLGEEFLIDSILNTIHPSEGFNIANEEKVQSD